MKSIAIMIAGKTTKNIKNKLGSKKQWYKNSLSNLNCRIKFINIFNDDLLYDFSNDDAWIITGSEYSVYDHYSWINSFKTLLNKAINDHMDKFVSEEQSKDHYHDRSYDINDFDFSFVFGLSLEDGAATLTEYTAFIISEFINGIPDNLRRVIVCGGGRKNKFLLKRISKKLKYS